MEWKNTCYRLAARDIGYLRFIIESYDGLAFMRTLDAPAGLVEIAWHPSRETDCHALLAALRREIGLVPAPQPEGWEPL